VTTSDRSSDRRRLTEAWLHGLLVVSWGISVLATASARLCGNPLMLCSCTVFSCCSFERRTCSCGTHQLSGLSAVRNSICCVTETHIARTCTRGTGYICRTVNGSLWAALCGGNKPVRQICEHRMMRDREIKCREKFGTRICKLNWTFGWTAGTPSYYLVFGLKRVVKVFYPVFRGSPWSRR